MPKSSWLEQQRLVYERANGCCEYCQTCEANTGQTMQVDHIAPGDGDSLENLCLSCWNCNNAKRKAMHGVDPLTGENVTLFNPRQQYWAEHFAWTDDFTRLDGLTATGRATITRLKMNRTMLVAARQRWVKNGYHPPKV